MRKPTASSSSLQAATLPLLGIAPRQIPDQSPPLEIVQNAGQMPDQVPVNHSAGKTAVLSQYCDKWTWEKSLIHKVQYNRHIQAWMDYYPEFYNWVRTCIMFHADNGMDETRCTIPDQWREEIGESITIVTANYLPVRQGTTHETKAGVYHVMA